jgi:adenylylsulfate kinase-like enzyme
MRSRSRERRVRHVAFDLVRPWRPDDYGSDRMLIVLSGLPGVGKTTIARELARSLAAVYVRVDSIEQALRQAGLVVEAE